MLDFLKKAGESVADAYNTVQDKTTEAKRKFTDALVDATDLTPADMRTQPIQEEQKAERKNVTGTLFDMATPDVTSLAGPIFKASRLGKVMGMVRKGENVAKDVSTAEKGLQTAEEILQASKKPNYGKVTVLDKTPKQVGFGKVTVLDDVPKQVEFGKTAIKNTPPTNAGIGKIKFADNGQSNGELSKDEIIKQLQAKLSHK